MARLILSSLLTTVVFLFGRCDADAMAGTPRYVPLHSCKSDNVCSYDYSGLLTHSVDSSTANVSVYATLGVSCSSSGEYARMTATKYCFTVTEGHMEYRGSEGVRVKKLDEELSAKPFCFIQTKDGKIPIVLHDSGENPEVLNFKKAIVSGFQANFNSALSDVNELDPESEHTSHYEYFTTPSKDKKFWHMKRKFDETDVAIPALPKSLGYSKSEEIEYNDGVLVRTVGVTRITVPKSEKSTIASIQTSPSANVKRIHEKEEIKQESMMNGRRHRRSRRRSARLAPRKDQSLFLQSASSLSAISIDYTYTLEQSSCSAATSRARRANQEPRHSRGTPSSLATTKETDADTKYTDMLSSLLAKIQEKITEQSQVESLRELLNLGSVPDSASPSVHNVHTSTTNQENWDKAGNEYDSIASFSQRQNDISYYPTNIGYLWTKQMGGTDFNIEVKSGMFSGADDNGEHSKIFGKTVAGINIYGHTFSLEEIEILREIGLDGVHKKVKISAGGKTKLIDSSSFGDELKLPNSLGSRNIEVPGVQVDVKLFVGVAVVNIQLLVNAQLNSSFSVNSDAGVNRDTQTSRAGLHTFLTIDIHGSSDFNVMGVKGSASIDGLLGYSIDFEGRVARCVAEPAAFRVSTTIRDQWPRGYLQIRPHLTEDCSKLQQGCDGKALESPPETHREIASRGSQILFEKHQTFGEQTQCALNGQGGGAKFQTWSNDWPVEANMGVGAHHTS